MRRRLTTVGACTAALSLTSCVAGPKQLFRTVSDLDHKTYVNSPWLNVALWIGPLPLGYLGALFGDCVVGNMVAFWGKDAWDGKGTGFKHAEIEPTDGQFGSLLNDGSGFLKKQ